MAYRERALQQWLLEGFHPEVDEAWWPLEKANDVLVDLNREEKAAYRLLGSLRSGTAEYADAKARYKAVKRKMKEASDAFDKADAAYEQAIQRGWAKFQKEQHQARLN